MAAVPSPPTPVLLYLGAGYDLSPLLSFAPNPPYQIAPRTFPPRATYTSFLFADAKPRHTSAFMVPDFDQWIDIPARVRNVVRYAQGMLDRWRLVTEDLIWFEGGGSPSHRRADPDWHVLPLPASAVSQSHARDRGRPLVTLIYAFNTLDIELARIPALARVWPCVTALYVHGLRPHTITGLDRLIGEQAPQPTAGEAVAAEGAKPSLTRSGLQHVYVLVGSWGTPRRGRACGAGAQRGVRHVDFVRAGRKQWRGRDGTDHSRANLAVNGGIKSRDILQPFDVSDSDSDVDTDTEMHSPVVFRRGGHPAWWDRNSAQESDSESDHQESQALHTPSLTTASTLDSQWPLSSRSCSSPRVTTVSISAGTRPRAASFYTRIPQIAWDDSLNDGRGGYYVSKTVEESLAVWRARGDGLLETESEDSSGEGDGSVGVSQARGHDIPRRIYPPPHRLEPSSARRRRSVSPYRRLRPRPALTSRPTSAPAGRHASSGSDTDVSRRGPHRRPFWRRGTTSLSGALFPRPPRERRIDLSDFLREPASPPLASPRGLPYTLRTFSCPDLKDSPGSHARGGSFSALRAFAAIRRGGAARTGQHGPVSPQSPRRFRLGGFTSPTLRTPASSPPPKAKSSPGTQRSPPREEPDWLGRLLCGSTTGVDSDVSDVTRVGD